MNNVESVKSRSIAAWQQVNRDIYLVANDRGFDTRAISSRIHRYSTHILKAVRKDKLDLVYHDIGMAFSWMLALANRWRIDLEKEIWQRFPGICPYCINAPCVCKEKRPVARQENLKSVGHKPETLRDFQRMFALIYLNTLQDAAMHLAEEAGEVDEALEHYYGTHAPERAEEVVVELVDAVSNLFAVATCIQWDLSDIMEFLFGGEVCPKCYQAPCSCGYIAER